MPSNLTRNLKSKCVMARITRQGQLYQSNFTLKQHGSWKKATSAAQQWVDQQKKKLPEQDSVRGLMTSRNASGVVGVRLDRGLRRKDGNEYENWRWVASWPGCPYSGGLAWPVATFGDEDAFALAVLSREAESVDRAAVQKSLARLKGSAKYKAILKRKSQKSGLPRRAARAAARSAARPRQRA